MSLRELKKEVTRSAIEDAGLRLFLDRGFEEVRVDDICSAVLVHRRTFFRYFNSKEDVVLSKFRRDLTASGEYLAACGDDESPRETLRALCEEMATRFDGEARDGNLARLRLINGVESLAAAYLKVLADFEVLLRNFLSSNSGEVDCRTVRMEAGMTVTAFRIALEIWQETDAAEPLRPTVAETFDIASADWY